jgi:hypothetical protein
VFICAIFNEERKIIDLSKLIEIDRGAKEARAQKI